MKLFKLLVPALFLLNATTALSKNLTVDAYYWSSKIEAQTLMRKGLEEEFQNYNKTAQNKITLIPHVAGDGRQGVLNQINQLEEGIKSKPDAMVIQPTDISTVTKALQEANTLGIPVFTFDQFILQGHITSYVASDNYQAGWDIGLHIDSLFPKGQAIKIIVVEYMRVSAVISRVDGFFDALRSKHRKFEVLKRYEAVEPKGGAQTAKQILQDFPKKKSFDVLFNINDGAGVTIVKMLWENGRKEIVHASVDGAPESIDDIKNKRLTVINSAQFCTEMGRETARQVIAYFNGKPVMEKKLIPTFPITIKTMSEFKGWNSTPNLPHNGGFVRPSTVSTPAERSVHRSASKNEKPVRIGIAPICPYLCEQGPGQWGGYVYEIIKDMAQTYKFSFEIVSLPNSDLEKALKNHTVQYIVIPNYLVRYNDDVEIYGPKLGASYTGALFTPGVRIRLVDKESLADKRIAFAKIGQESDLNLDPAEFKKSLKIEGADVADRMIKAISDRRVDLALGDYNVLRYTLLRRQQLNLEIQPTSLTGFNTLSLVSLPEESRADLPAHLQDWFVDAREDGKLDRILKKYNLNDWNSFNH